MLDAVITHRLRHALHTVETGQALARDTLDTVDQRGERAERDREVEVVLAAKVEIERALAQLRLARDVFHRRRHRADAEKRTLRRIDDLAAALFALAFPSLGYTHFERTFSL